MRSRSAPPVHGGARRTAVAPVRGRTGPGAPVGVGMPASRRRRPTPSGPACSTLRGTSSPSTASPARRSSGSQRPPAATRRSCSTTSAGRTACTYEALYVQTVTELAAEVPLDVDDLPEYAGRLHDVLVRRPWVQRLTTWHRLEGRRSRRSPRPGPGPSRRSNARSGPVCSRGRSGPRAPRARRAARGVLGRDRAGRRGARRRRGAAAPAAGRRRRCGGAARALTRILC